MSDNFKALVVKQEGENFTREVKSIDKSFLKHGDVLVKIDYSDLNYKDALILNNGAKLVKEFPHIPGIDFSGTVLESDNSKFAKGDEVILTGWRVGEIYFGGYSQFAKVNGDYIYWSSNGPISVSDPLITDPNMTGYGWSSGIGKWSIASNPTNINHTIGSITHDSAKPIVGENVIGNALFAAIHDIIEVTGSTHVAEGIWALVGFITPSLGFSGYHELWLLRISEMSTYYKIEEAYKLDYLPFYGSPTSYFNFRNHIIYHELD